MPYPILTLNNISVRGLARLPAERYHFGAELAAPDAILVRSAELRQSAIAASVCAIGRAGAGVNNIPVEAMSERGIPVFNTPAPTPTPSRSSCWPDCCWRRAIWGRRGCSRAAIVDEAAVIAALAAGRLHAYVCDFPCAALRDQARVIALPHLGASTGEAEENCAVMVVEQVRDFLENGNIRNSVNYPEIVLPRMPNTTRLGIANRNVPNMVGQISTCLAAHRLNIADLLNKSRGEYAYTLIDVDGRLSPELLGELRAIDRVLSARAPWLVRS
jgi:hypothetical protein